MKLTLTLIMVLCFTLIVKAQVEKTLEVTAGTLKTMLTPNELITVTNLTISGTIDARDFKILRDEMPVLAVVDMSNAIITAYTGPDGPSVDTTNYVAHVIPQDAFHREPTGKSTLQSVLIPLTTKAIGPSAFTKCTGLTSFVFPLTVDSIQSLAFSGCSGIKNVDIPSSVTHIGERAFEGCSGMESLILPQTITTIGRYAFRACVSLSGTVTLPTGITAIREGTFSICRSLTSVSIPSSIDSIYDCAFYECEQLTSLTLPSALVYIGPYAFFRCRQLTGSLSLPSTLTTIGRNAFDWCDGLNSLVIPSSVISIGKEAFKFCINLTFIEVKHLFPSKLYPALDVFNGIDKTTTTLRVPYGTKLRYAHDYGWYNFKTIVEDTQGFLLNKRGLLFDIEGESDSSAEVKANIPWKANANQPWLTVTPSSGDSSQTLTVTAEANLASGKSRIGTITIRGEGVPDQTLQVRQESTPTIIHLTPGSLSTALTSEEKRSVTNLCLTGSMDARDFKTIHDEMPLMVRLDLRQVTIEAFYEYGEILFYPANTIPYAHSWNNDFNTEFALAGHPNLTIIKLPVSLTAVGYMAFNNCTSLTSIELQSPVSKIEHYTFFNCSALESVILPSTITYIGVEVFRGCTELKSIYCHAIYPPELDADLSVYEVFVGVNINNCILYVPFGTKELYENSGEWGNFNNIVEMNGLFLSTPYATIEAEQGSTSSIRITSDVNWQVSFSQPWLSVSPYYGKGVRTLTFTADANTTNSARTATVTVSAPGINPQIITITQNGLTTGVSEMVQNGPLITCYPNPFTQKITIDIQNPKKEKMMGDIYNLAGQKVKNLNIANRAEKLTLTWDGTNAQGQQVPKGVYLLKVNGYTCKVVYGR